MEVERPPDLKGNMKDYPQDTSKFSQVVDGEVR